MKKVILIITAVMMTASSTTFAQNQAQYQSKIFFDPTVQPEEYCLALNTYYETRSSNLADKAAVADVVLNRVRDSRYPNTICEVVKQGPVNSKGMPKRHRCQFSWYCDGKSDMPKNVERWLEAQSIAYNIIYHKKYRGITEGATHYHATYVSPRWTKDMNLIGRIGAHIYYRWD